MNFVTIKKWPEYKDWAKSIWFTREDSEDEDHRLLMVSVLGLSGETAELADAIRSMDEKTLLKELGDVFYYLTILCDKFHVDLSSQGVEVSRVGPPVNEYLSLCTSVGQVTEFFKKYVRGDKDKIDIYQQAIKQDPNNYIQRILFQVNANLLMLVQSVGLDIHQVIVTNKNKLVSRKSRGVLRGDGNDR